jgi:hypothetical protein
MTEDCGCEDKKPSKEISRRQSFGLAARLLTGSVLGIGAATLGLSWRPKAVKAGWFYCHWLCIFHDEYYYCEWCWDEWWFEWPYGWVNTILCVADSYTLMPWGC